ncbi:MAG: DUF1659 domain-containing protein [Clostridium sp.]
MAVVKNLVSTSLVLDVRHGVDNSGKPTYRKRTFNQLKEGATTQNIFDVANKIKGAFAGETRDITLSESHRLIQE